MMLKGKAKEKPEAPMPVKAEPVVVESKPVPAAKSVSLMKFLAECGREVRNAGAHLDVAFRARCRENGLETRQMPLEAWRKAFAEFCTGPVSEGHKTLNQA